MHQNRSERKLYNSQEAIIFAFWAVIFLSEFFSDKRGFNESRKKKDKEQEAICQNHLSIKTEIKQVGN